MSTTSKTAITGLRYKPAAYQFVFAALRVAQEQLGRSLEDDDEEASHVSGPELLEGIRRLALNQFGLMTNLVFHHWGIQRTDDFGHMVFEMIERGEMRKTDRDQLGDFEALYDFSEAFDRDYRVDVSEAFRK